MIKDEESALLLLWGGAAIVLLVGGLNIANLTPSRWNGRSKEVATRLALCQDEPLSRAS